MSETILKTQATEIAGEELLERTRKLLPTIASRRDEGDRLRDTPAITVEEIKAALLTRIFQPKRWGGLEADPRIFYAIQNEMAAVCPSTAWVYGVHAIQPFMLAMMDMRAQEELWGDDADTLCASSFAPQGKAERVDGGFRLSGRWTFSSGSSFTKWALVGAHIVGDPPPPTGWKPPEIFLVPATDYEILDVWDTFGLRATGSNDLVAKDIFVPAHRQFTFEGGINTATRADLPRLYRLPWLYMMSSSINNLAIGMGRGALDAFLDIARKRVSPVTGKAMKDDPATLAAITRLMAEIENAEAMYDRHITAFFDHVDREELLPMQQALLYRTQMTSVARRMAAVLDELTLMQGSRALFRDSLLTRFWLDLAAARTHIGNDPNGPGGMLGQMMLAQG